MHATMFCAQLKQEYPKFRHQVGVLVSGCKYVHVEIIHHHVGRHALRHEVAASIVVAMSGR